MKNPKEYVLKRRVTLCIVENPDEEKQEQPKKKESQK
jgi:hypothetical protein